VDPALSGRRRAGPAVAAFLALAGALAAALVLFLTARGGAGVSPDSVMYLSAARSLLAGHGLVGCQGAPFVEWAPLVPGLMALAALAGLEPFAAIRMVNALAAGAIAILVGVWLLRRTRSTTAAALGALGMAAAAPLTQVSIYVWSDTLFALLALAAVLALDGARGRRGVRRALWPAAWTALACLDRYVGGTLVAAGVLFFLLERARSGRERLGAALAFAMASSLPIGLWVMRNALVSGTATGAREPATSSVLANAGRLVSPLADMLFPWSVPTAAKVAVVGAAAAALVVAGARARRPRPPAAGAPGALALFAGCYAVGLVAVSSVWASDVIDARLALPLWVAALPLLIQGAHAAVGGATAPAARRARATLLALVAVFWLARTGVVTLRRAEGVRRDGIAGLTDPHWRHSALRAALAAGAARGTVFTNAPELCYLATGSYARMVPHRVPVGPRAARGDRYDEMRRALAGRRPVYLVWAWGWRSDQLVALADLRARFSLRWTAWHPEGVVFRVSPRAP
jgi:hypothetical protein